MHATDKEDLLRHIWMLCRHSDPQTNCSHKVTWRGHHFLFINKEKLGQCRNSCSTFTKISKSLGNKRASDIPQLLISFLKREFRDSSAIQINHHLLTKYLPCAQHHTWKRGREFCKIWVFTAVAIKCETLMRSARRQLGTQTRTQFPGSGAPHYGGSTVGQSACCAAHSLQPNQLLPNR